MHLHLQANTPTGPILKRRRIHMLRLLSHPQRNALRAHHVTITTRPVPNLFHPEVRISAGSLSISMNSQCTKYLLTRSRTNLMISLPSSYIATVAGAQFTRTGNLVLTTTPATSTKQILASDMTTATISCLREHLGLSEEGESEHRIYPADPWHRVVIHNISFCDVQKIPGPKGSWWEQNKKSIESEWREYNPVSRSAALPCSKALRYLIPDLVTEEVLKAKGTVSMCIAFDNIKLCILTWYTLWGVVI
jgi:hypothetical protein